MFANRERISENTSAPSAIPITKAITGLFTYYKTTRATVAEQDAVSKAKGRRVLGDFVPLKTSAMGENRIEWSDEVRESPHSRHPHRPQLMEGGDIAGSPP
jgi:hypothetical protein